MENDRLRNLRVEIESYGFCETHSGWHMRFSASDAASLHYCLAGVGTMMVMDENDILLLPGTLVLLPKGVAYGFKSGPKISSECNGDEYRSKRELSIFRAGDGDEEPLIVSCGEIMLGSGGASDILAWLTSPTVSTATDGAPSDGALSALFQTVQSGGTISAALMETLLKSMLIQIVETRSQDPVAELWGMNMTPDRQLAAALDHILKHPGANITIKDLCLAAGLSRSLLFDRFQANLGISPSRFILDIRLGNAAHLLRTTERSIGDITHTAGFSSRSHFNRKFRGKYGQTPGQFRAVVKR